MRSVLILALVLSLSTSSSRADGSWAATITAQLSAALAAACEGRERCLLQVSEFAAFLWRHRDEADFQARALKCVGQTALMRGYVWSPSKLLDDMTPETVPIIGLEVCQCATPEVLEERVCGMLR